jgi:hypothetical protein
VQHALILAASSQCPLTLLDELPASAEATSFLSPTYLIDELFLCLDLLCHLDDISKTPGTTDDVVAHEAVAYKSTDLLGSPLSPFSAFLE